MGVGERGTFPLSLYCLNLDFFLCRGVGRGWAGFRSIPEGGSAPSGPCLPLSTPKGRLLSPDTRVSSPSSLSLPEERLRSLIST